jgi:hypothetical protein
LQSDASRAIILVDKMRDEVIRLQNKSNDLRVERSQLKEQQEFDLLESQTALADVFILNLRSLLDRIILYFFFLVDVSNNSYLSIRDHVHVSTDTIVGCISSRYLCLFLRPIILHGLTDYTSWIK